MDWIGDFWAWAWARHHNPLSWYIRPLSVLPYGHFAYKRSVAGLVLTVVGVLTGMFWFPAPAEVDPRAPRSMAARSPGRSSRSGSTGSWRW